MEVVDYIYKPYTKTICFFRKMHTILKRFRVNNINALWVERFLLMGFCRFDFFFWMLRSKGLCCFGIDGCSCSTHDRTSSLAMPRSLGARPWEAMIL